MRALTTVGGGGGAVETAMRAVTPVTLVTLFALQEVAGTVPIVSCMADLGS